jgi:peroxiredoxin/outer membrane lipoprotein-sorting protein
MDRDLSVRRFIPQAGARLCILALLGAALTAGCNKATPPKESGGVAGTDAGDAPTTARAVLDRMLKAYREASSYADSGQLLVRYDREDGERVPEDVDFSVTFVRPNKLRMHLYQAIVVSDGKDLRATVGDLPNQVLSVPAPRKLTHETLYTDPILTPVLTQGIVGASIQLAMLVSDNALDGLLDGADAPTLLEPSEVEGDPCYRVQLNPSFGKVVFWIDKKTYVLRRINFPEVFGRDWLRQNGQQATNTSIVAEFKGARLNEKIDEQAFQVALPEGAKLVDQLIVQPKLLGQKAPGFEFRPLAGGTVTKESLAGKTAVIAFWESSADPSLKTLADLEQVYQKYKDNDKIAFLAVSIDGDKTTDDQLRETLAKAKCTIPILRDPRQLAQTVFEIQVLPSLFVIGPEGTVQYVEAEYSAELPKRLPPMLDKLLAGQSIYEEAMRENERRQRKLSAAPVHAPDAAESTVTEIPKADIADRSQPERLKLAPLWTCRELKQPGNILVVERSNASPQLLICDGKRAIVELDSAGTLVARHDLDVPLTSDVAFLRTAVARDGQRYFAACGPAQQQVHLFDADFKRLMSYPAEGQHAGIYDVQLADLDGDGQPELNVGYLGVVGVQNASLDGTRRWSNRSVADVRSLAVSAPARSAPTRSGPPGSGPAEGGPDATGARYLLAAAAGSITPIDDRGKNGPPMSIDGLFVRTIVAADQNGDGQMEYCCIAAIRVGMETAIGLSSDLREQWRYELPLGAQPNPALEMIAAGRVKGPQSQWILAGADGSIHILASDGSLLDRFNYGAAISGLAVAQFDAQPTLIVATANGVDAWRVEEPATAAGSSEN